jgi:hypothetical protein
MKKIVTVILVSLCVFNYLNAQEVIFGVKGGINFADITGDETESFEGRTSFYLGVLAEIPISGKFYFQPEIMYSEQGSDYKDSFSESDGEFIYTETAEGEVKLSYINIPLMAKYYVYEGLSLEVGPQIGFLLSAKDEYKYTFTGDGITESESGEEDIKDYVKGVDFGLNFGLGYKLKNGINFSARYNLGLSDANDDEDYLGDSSYKNSVIQVGIGYFF